jgi:hypothetical protein
MKRTVQIAGQVESLFGTLDEVLGHHRRYTPSRLFQAQENS